MVRLTTHEQSVLRSESGPHVGRCGPLFAFPTLSFGLTFLPMWPFVGPFGNHWTVCSRAGVVERRGCAFESAVSTILRSRHQFDCEGFRRDLSAGVPLAVGRGCHLCCVFCTQTAHA